jgi:hypothetical protein
MGTQPDDICYSGKRAGHGMVHSLREHDKTGGVIFHIDSAMTLACCPFAAKERVAVKRGERRSTEPHDSAK